MVVAAGAVVRGEIPSHCVVAGVPARVVRRWLPERGWVDVRPEPVAGPPGRATARPGPLMNRAFVGVVGPADATASLERTAEEVGRLVAEAGAVLVCGGLGGVMAAACRGAAAGGGLTVGILPGDDRRSANPWVAVPVATGLGELRNGLVVRGSDVLVAVGGGYGTLSEVALALKIGRPVVGLGTWGLVRPDGTGDRAVTVATDPASAVEHAGGIGPRRRRPAAPGRILPSRPIRRSATTPGNSNEGEVGRIDGTVGSPEGGELPDGGLGAPGQPPPGPPVSRSPVANWQDREVRPTAGTVRPRPRRCGPPPTGPTSGAQTPSATRTAVSVNSRRRPGDGGRERLATRVDFRGIFVAGVSLLLLPACFLSYYSLQGATRSGVGVHATFTVLAQAFGSWRVVIPYLAALCVVIGVVNSLLPVAATGAVTVFVTLRVAVVAQLAVWIVAAVERTPTAPAGSAGGRGDLGGLGGHRRRRRRRARLAGLDGQADIHLSEAPG